MQNAEFRVRNWERAQSYFLSAVIRAKIFMPLVRFE